jgi:hypothetical protein
VTPEGLDTARVVFFFWSGLDVGVVVGVLLTLLAQAVVRRVRR